MKLAEGLLLRADLQKKIDQLVGRLHPNLVINEKHNPQEDPVKLLAQMRKSIEDLEELIIRINKTNNETYIEGVGTMMEALAKRDSLKLMSERLRNIRQWSQIPYRTTLEKQKATLDIKKLQIEMDQVGRKFREIDSLIQQHNWLTELKE